MTTSTFDNVPPTRPVNADMISVDLQDRTGKAPDPTTMPTAEGWNQRGLTAAAAGKMVPLALLDLRFPGGVPTLQNVLAAGSAPVPGSFTCVDNGNGDTSIWWADGLLPSTFQPMVSQTDDTEIDRVRAFYTTVSSHPAVRVKTKLGATGTDAQVLIAIF